MTAARPREDARKPVPKAMPEAPASTSPDPAPPGSAGVPADGPPGLTTAEASARRVTDGPNEVPEPSRHPLLRFLSKFWNISAWMIEAIVVLSFILGNYNDAWIALALLVVNAVISFYEEEHASAAVRSLRSQLQIMVRVRRDAKWTLLPARDLVRGDVVRLRAGDFVPADARILEGELGVDQSAMTGESAEIVRGIGTTCYAGSIVRRGEATAEISATGTRTYFGRTIELVEHARPTLHTDEVTARLTRWLLGMVAVLVVIAIGYSLARGLGLTEILPLSLVLLLGAVPVALPVMFTVSTAVAAVRLAREGVLVTRLTATEDAASMDVLCADKTGTLTWNRLGFERAIPREGFTEDVLVRDGAWASSEANQDPIDVAFLAEARRRSGDRAPDGARMISFVPFSAATRHTEATWEMQGHRVRVMKGALRTVAGYAGLPSQAADALEASVATDVARGARVLAVAESVEEGTWRMVGLVLLSDPPRPDSRPVIHDLRGIGIDVKMLTGDALPVARTVGAELGLSNVIRAPELAAATAASPQAAAALIARVDGVAEVLPEDKLRIVEGLQHGSHIVGMTGDGVNDAPALRQAEVGIAVSGATDLAKESASIVLTAGGLVPIVDLVRAGRAVHERVLTWILNKVSRVFLQTGFVALALFLTGALAISAFGMILLLFMTDFVKVSLATDRVEDAPKPRGWNIKRWIVVGSVVGAAMLVESLALFIEGPRFLAFGASTAAMHAFAFQILLFFALFSIVSIRERRAFWASVPGKALGIALAADAALGLVMGYVGLADMGPLPPSALAFVFVAAGVVSLGINDPLKRLMVRRTAAWEIEGPQGSPASANAKKPPTS
ncbi:MAG: plasma-membrane proton-efflux P-type ATPase [Thermoplasmatota archaeon]